MAREMDLDGKIQWWGFLVCGSGWRWVEMGRDGWRWVGVGRIGGGGWGLVGGQWRWMEVVGGGWGVTVDNSFIPTVSPANLLIRRSAVFSYLCRCCSLGSKALFQLFQQQNLPPCFDFRTGSLGGMYRFDFLEPHSLSEPIKSLCSDTATCF